MGGGGGLESRPSVLQYLSRNLATGRTQHTHKTERNDALLRHRRDIFVNSSQVLMIGCQSLIAQKPPKVGDETVFGKSRPGDGCVIGESAGVSGGFSAASCTQGPCCCRRSRFLLLQDPSPGIFDLAFCCKKSIEGVLGDSYRMTSQVHTGLHALTHCTYGLLFRTCP